MEAIWENEAGRVEFPPLEGDATTDVLIVGGGLTGILCAHALRRAGVDCMLIEAKRLCSGTTGHTTAKVTWQHGLMYDKLISRYGRERAGLYLAAQREACEALAALARELDSDYEEKDAFVYSLFDRAAIEREIRAIEALGGHATFSHAKRLPLAVAGAVRVKGQGQLHPLRLAMWLSRELPIYEGTKTLELFPDRVLTNRGTVRCKSIIIATHFPMLNKHGGYFLKLYQHRSYVLALEGAGDVGGMYVDESATGLSFRNYGKYLLLGGGAHRTGKAGGTWRVLEDFATAHYQGARVAARWGAQDCMTLDGMPYIGAYGKHTRGLFVATGYNKWGMSSSMLAATVLRDAILGRQNEYASLLSPTRSMLHPQLAANAYHSLVGLLTPTAPRCPHMGCALKYNRAEHSWDCPCHGSRFSADGALIDNPATDDKRM